MRAWKVWLVAGDCFLIGLAPVLVHMSKGPDGKFPFHPVSINLLVEVAKTFFAVVVIMIYVSPLSCPCPESAHCHIQAHVANASLIFADLCMSYALFGCKYSTFLNACEGTVSITDGCSQC